MDLREPTVCQRPTVGVRGAQNISTEPVSFMSLPNGTMQSIKSRVAINLNNNNDQLLLDGYCNNSQKADIPSAQRQRRTGNNVERLRMVDGQTEPDTTARVGEEGQEHFMRPINKPSRQQDSYNDLNNLLDKTSPDRIPNEEPDQESRVADTQTSVEKLSKRPRRLDKIDSKLVVAPSNNNINDSNNNNKTAGSICSCGAKQQTDAKKEALHSSSPFLPNIPKRTLSPPHKLVSLGERNGRSICNKHMPWFGIDVGGSLVKVVFFDPKDATREETVTLKRIRRYLKSSKAYGTTGKRDAHLEMPNCVINKRVGSLHFIRFATNQMPDFLSMADSKRFTDTINTVCATGGGAYKFEQDIKNNLDITLHKTDELDSIIHGIHYIDKYNSERECYFLDDPLNESRWVKVPYDFSRPYPYLVVNIGSGVSILAVYSSTCYSRISGSSIGGGTFLGLCCLLTQCKTFDEAIRLAKAGSSAKIDKLVKDIYGGDYPKFNLTGDTVASSFGHMNIPEKRKGLKREDLARALLEMVTINIGSIARMCAANENIDRVVFIGNFLRVNQLSMRLLSYAVNYWSKGAIKALFLEHEGYFGAVGCLVESIQLQ